MTTHNPPGQAASAGVVDIEELEWLAKRALEDWSRDEAGNHHWWRPDTIHRLQSDDDVDDAEFIAAASPTTTLALIAEIRAHREREASAGWVSVAERMPEVGERVLLLSDGDMETGNWGGGRVWWTGPEYDDAIPDHEVTHWMPLPRPPTPPAPEAPAPTETL